jgi:hypothetical protein
MPCSWFRCTIEAERRTFSLLCWLVDFKAVAVIYTAYSENARIMVQETIYNRENKEVVIKVILNKALYNYSKN